jgi:2-methylcitrate dehydratase PrpD
LEDFVGLRSILHTLATHAVALQTGSLPGEVRHHARRALIDWFAALLPGSQLPPATLLLRALGDETCRDEGAVLYGTSRRGPIRTAALVNGTASHTVEFDDIFRDAVYHPGSPTIAAALAAAQARGADGERLLRAIVVGYEISTRLGIAVQPAHYRFWHTTGTIGTFGAATAVATVLGLDKTGHAHALATAATFAAGLQQAFRSDAMSKPLHAGHAAEAGALAALAAAEGVTGALDVLEGPAGFGAAMGGSPDWSKATAALGECLNITRMTFKNHGCCGHAFAPVDAALALKRAHSISFDDIESVEIGTYQAALDVTNRHKVASAFEGRFSTPYAVATALVHGSVRLDAFSPERLRDVRVQTLMRRVRMVRDPLCEADFPRRRAAVVEIRLRDGRRLRHYQPTRKGDPDAPLTDSELNEKFRELTAPVIGAAAAARLLAELWHFDERPDAELGAPA